MSSMAPTHFIASGGKPVEREWTDAGAPDGTLPPATLALYAAALDVPFSCKARAARSILRSSVRRQIGGQIRQVRCGVVGHAKPHGAVKLNPHTHAVFLDGHYVERADELTFEVRSRVSTSDVADVLRRTRDKMFAYLHRRGMLALADEDDANEMAPRAASAVAGTTPPAGAGMAPRQATVDASSNEDGAPRRRKKARVLEPRSKATRRHSPATPPRRDAPAAAWTAHPSWTNSERG